MRLGIDLHVLPQIDPKLFDELIVETRPGFVQRLSGGAESGDQRDVRRATLIRQRIAARTRTNPKADHPAEEA
jgi:protein arginine kinase